MSAGLRDSALTAHITSPSVARAVCAFLLWRSRDWPAGTSAGAGAYLAMSVTAWFVIAPLSIASPLTGIVQSLATTRGLVRHYWVLIKLLMTIPSTAVLLLAHMQPIDRLAHAAADGALGSADLSGLRIHAVVAAGAAGLVLLVATALSVYKLRHDAVRGAAMPMIRSGRTKCGHGINL